jgi:hypothetical protein
MKEEIDRTEEGQSIVIVVFAVLVLLVFVVIAVDLSHAYVHRRGDQNAADASALAGARALADVINENEGVVPSWAFADPILVEMHAYAEANGIEDTNSAPGDNVNQNVTGYWLDETGNRITDSDGNAITIDQGGYINQNARGVEVIANSLAPTFFGGVVGLDSLPIQAESAVVFSGDVCSMSCLAPIATYTMTFQTDDNGDGFPCYNIWDGTRQQNGGGNCPDWGDCIGGKCSLNNGITCKKTADCSGVCPGGTGVCTLPADGSLTCSKDNECPSYGKCKNSVCQGDSSISCTDDLDCTGVCEPSGWVCSGNGDPCVDDADCPPDEFCEDQVGSSGSASGLGWLNWSLQGSDHSCDVVPQPGVGSDCSASCLGYNLTPGTCLSGEIGVSDGSNEVWVAGAAGVKNASFIRDLLACYAGLAPPADCLDWGAPITVVIYDQSRGRGCNQSGNVGSGHLEYRVVGFAEFNILGYQLSNGTWYGHDGAGCEDWGAEGNRITGTFIRWVDGTPGDCDTNGTITAPKVIK